MKILLTGSCQVEGIAACMRSLCPEADVHALRLAGNWRERWNHWDADLVFCHGGKYAEEIGEFRERLRVEPVFFPNLVFAGFHPDMIGIDSIRTHTAVRHSAIAWLCFRKGIGVDETLSLFNEETFARLGYFDAWDESVAQLVTEGQRLGWPVENLLARWVRSGVFMYTVNHPHLRILAEIAHQLLIRSGIDSARLLPPEAVGDRLPADRLERQAIWSVYPGIAEARGLAGSYAFTEPVRSSGNRETIGLREFVARSFSVYERADLAAAVVHGNRLSHIERQLDDWLQEAGLARDPQHGNFRPDAAAGSRMSGHGASQNPYSNLDDHHFWRTAVSALPAAEIDPVVRAAFRIGRDEKIATAGSCFAQHIALALQRNGFNYFVTEPAPPDCSGEDAHRRNYGVFPARYGNLYTARQLLQTFDRAFGYFTPRDIFWERMDGRFADPFRPQIEPEGFATVDALIEDRERHLAAVRRMFAEMDVFIFTLGLTESWESVRDGAVFPLAPGVAAGCMDEGAYRFVNYSANEVTNDLAAFLDRLRTVNARARVILTVSPVPLVATYEDRHVLVSTTYSKSALRVAAEEIVRANGRVAYFPSYEIVSGHYNRGAYFTEDLRGITPAGVDHVMRLFFRHYAADASAAGIGRNPEFDLVCDEEALDEQRPPFGT